jgi:hypothetical protein
MDSPSCSPPIGPGTSARRAASPADPLEEEAEAGGPGAATAATVAAGGLSSASVPDMALVITWLARRFVKLRGCE